MDNSRGPVAAAQLVVPRGTEIEGDPRSRGTGRPGAGAYRGLIRARVEAVLERVDELSPVLLVGATLLVLLNLTNIAQVIEGGYPDDWTRFVAAGQRALAGGSIYLPTNAEYWGFSYAPPMAYLFGLLIPIGFLGWLALHLVGAVALPRPLGAVALLTFPWWWDALAGNVLTFVLLFAAWALRGHAWAIALTLIAAVLMPRPLVVPLVIWILWRYPEWRLRFAGIVLAVGLASIATGQTTAYLEVVARSGSDIVGYWNVSPSRFLGLAWLPIGIVLAAVLLRRGYVGLACLAAAPYLLPYYVLLGLLDLDSRGARLRRDVAVGDRAPEVAATGRGAGLRLGNDEHPGVRVEDLVGGD